MTKATSAPVIVHLQGGFGNQAFIYFAGLAQARRLNTNLLFDMQWFEDLELGRHEDTIREVVLGKFLGHPMDILLKKKNAFSLTRFFQSKRIFRDTPYAWIDINKAVEPGMTLIGYFQSANFFEAIKEEVLSTWNSYAPSTSEEKFQADFEGSDFITAHVRRGDYLHAKTLQFHGLSSAHFFTDAIHTLRQIYGNLPVKVFTDSPSVVAKELSQIPNLSIVDQSGISEPAAILAMAKGKAMVMSNSSFSWWAAYLLTQQSGGAVIAPRPWFADGTTPPGLLLPQWLTLGN